MIVLDKLNATIQTLQKLEALHSSEAEPNLAPLNSGHPAIQLGCTLLGWKLCPPLPPQWAYWHCMTDQGGIVPFDLSVLIQRLESLAAATSDS